MRLGGVGCVLLAVVACGDTGTAPGGDEDPDSPRLEEVVAGLGAVVHLASPPGDARLFVVEQAGRIRIVQNGQLLATPFLDITDRVGAGESEQGLLSVAFHPDYAANGSFYVNYTNEDGDTRVERYTVSGDPDLANAGSAHLILSVDQPFQNHNGGMIAFGPDGMLYIGMGDGGSAGDPDGNGQNRNTLLGALLRIDVDGGDPYAIPPGNPFIGVAGTRPEIWAYGLRNPWRFSFDPPAGRLYIADVGQNQWEEVNAVDASAAGVNYGWNEMEGEHCYPAGSVCDPADFTLPVLEYSHSDGCSVTGGAVYRGSAVPDLVGHYVYADYCEGWIRSFRFEGGSVMEAMEWDIPDVGRILSFGRDAEGELHVLALRSGVGSVYRVVPGS